MGVEKANPNQKGVSQKRVNRKEQFVIRKNERITWLKVQIEKDPLLLPSSLYPKFNKRYNLSRITFNKDVNEANKLMQQDINVVQTAITNSKVTKALTMIEKGHRTKEDRIKMLNDLIDQTENDLMLGTHKQERILNGKAINYNRTLTPMEKIRYRDAIKGYIAEISKLNGEYAPKRITFDSELFDGMTKNEISDAIEIFTPFVELAPIESE